MIAPASFLGLLLLGGPSSWAARSSAPYVALGDSYASGPGIKYQSGGPCTRSSRNYARLVAEDLGLVMQDRSCMSATTRAVLGWQYFAVPPQIRAVGPETRIVTISIGGNDIGFVDLVAHCTWAATPGTHCTDRYVTAEGNVVTERLERASAKVGHVLDRIHEEAPAARVFVVGYPSVLPDDGDCSWALTLARGDLDFLGATISDLNAMVAREATEHGAVFVDTQEGSRGHDACAGPMDRWVEPTLAVGAAAPLHRNAAGMRFAADQVIAAIRATEPAL